ncbi:MAG: hypothetical protein NW215_00490 [Hyphomicrobiales bacterium]|nr:hypothetical protein [Hyphomicrobiales bacterium]
MIDIYEHPVRVCMAEAGFCWFMDAAMAANRDAAALNTAKLDAVPLEGCFQAWAASRATKSEMRLYGALVMKSNSLRWMAGPKWEAPPTKRIRRVRAIARTRRQTVMKTARKCIARCKQKILRQFLNIF